MIKIKELLKKIKNKKNFITNDIFGYILYQNDHLKIVSDACSICYNNNKYRTYDEKANYIRRRIASGHESILEHSNVVIKCVISINEKTSQDFIEIAPCFRYLNIKIKRYNINKKYFLILSGSIRGYKHILRTISNPTNKIYNCIKNALYELNSCYFEDLIEDQIMDRHCFLDIIDEKNKLKDYNKNKKVNIVSYDLDKLITNLCDIMPINDILDLASITILFKGVSRTASHQLVRHRAGITQLSQRYTDSSNLKFINPINFKLNKYNKDDKYKIIFNHINMELSLDELSNNLMNIYPKLLDQGLLKEDARSFLPSNIETSLYMTFTFKGLLKFLELRTSKAAQSEIRNLALDLKNQLDPLFKKYNITYNLLDPEYKIIENKQYNLKIDEPIK